MIRSFLFRLGRRGRITCVRWSYLGRGFSRCCFGSLWFWRCICIRPLCSGRLSRLLGGCGKHLGDFGFWLLLGGFELVCSAKISECPDRCAYENERPEISPPPSPQVFDFIFDRIEPGGLVPKLCLDVVFGFDFALNGDEVVSLAFAFCGFQFFVCSEHEGFEFFKFDRFAQEIVGEKTCRAEAVEFFFDFLGWVTCNHRHAEVTARRFAQFLENFNAIHVGHLVVESDDFDRFLVFDEIESFFAICGSEDPGKAHVFAQKGFQAQLKRGIFVDDEDDRSQQGDGGIRVGRIR